MEPQRERLTKAYWDEGGVQSGLKADKAGRKKKRVCDGDTSGAET